MLLALTVGCGRRSGVIERPGSYPSPGGGLVLSVRIDGKGLVQYHVEEPTSGKTVFTNGGFSTYHRWFFYWDTGSRLWCHDSDMGGLSLWQDDGTGTWSHTDLHAGSALVGTIPAPVLERLPDTTRKGLGIP
jgi:hypothetical protein